MVLLLRPILLRFLQSDAVKLLLLECLQRLSERSDNQLDDMACKYIEDLLFPERRVEK